MPLLSRVSRVTAFRREYQQLPLLSIARQLMDCPAPVSVAQFPRFDCGAQGEGRSGFAQEGCFAGPGAAFQTLDVWPYATLRGGTAAQGKAAQQRVLRTVLQTNTGFRFHFGRGADGRWRLLYLDLRVPCSA
ncbi:hypothetical protein FY528_09175 [Hymenobacter lutimineralis]|uniref:Uncharacterized protein n=1 Tax=Hymenobacter lutimineralis TaxID=2606448 RepID=A0A5D6V510_9BACT|nr:hypothetical protein [Hymenobacter lutimineralis]TYZ10028.1 hypothetical protein FY528_09175 [Hymenobacter lutimineralis]